MKIVKSILFIAVRFRNFLFSIFLYDERRAKTLQNPLRWRGYGALEVPEANEGVPYSQGQRNTQVLPAEACTVPSSEVRAKLSYHSGITHFHAFPEGLPPGRG